MPPNFLAGAVSLGYLVVGVFFLRFWKSTRDPFFLLFAFAFGLLAVERILLAVIIGATVNSMIYVIRLTAFLLIIWAIIQKNRRST
jgi:hypothetical protein